MSAPEERFKAAKLVKLLDIVYEPHTHQDMCPYYFYLDRDQKTINCADAIILTYISNYEYSGPPYFTMNINVCKHVITNDCQVRNWHHVMGAFLCTWNSMYVNIFFMYH